MTRIYDIRLKEQTEQWMTQYDEHLTHACTFTFKQAVDGKLLSADDIWEYWFNYCKYVNRLIYKHAAKNHNKSLLILPTLHGEVSNKRLHIHAAIGCVDKDISFDKIKALLNAAWREMKWTEHETEIVPYRNSGWINYMLHESVRMDLHSVDITRCCIPPSLKS
jgi:hypothetical protein